MKQIGLMLRLQDNYDMAVAQGVVQYARTKSDWQVRGQGPGFFPLEKQALRECDALIARIEDEQEAELCSSLGIPVVDIAGSALPGMFNQVRNDDYLTGVSAGEYLSGLGSNRAAWCGVDHVHWARERYNGFSAGFGLPDARICRFSKPLTWWRHIYDPAAELDTWLSSLEKPVSIFCCNDLSAMKVELACRRLGIDIPTEVMVLGVDNETLLCELASPSISSIQPDCRTIGYEASALIDRMLNSQNIGIQTKWVPPGPVTERESTRVVFCDDEEVAKALRLIKEKATEGLGASEVADHASVSRRTLEKRFRQYRGRTIWEEICLQKIEQACQLMAHSNLTVNQVAEQCAFGSPHRFYILFKRYMNLTPYQYRMQKSRL